MPMSTLNAKDLSTFGGPPEWQWSLLERLKERQLWCDELDYVSSSFLRPATWGAARDFNIWPPVLRTQRGFLAASTIPVRQGIVTAYGYVPTKSVAVVFIVLLCASTLFHIGQESSPKMRWLHPTVGPCGILETLGWATRLWSSITPGLFGDCYAALVVVECCARGLDPVIDDDLDLGDCERSLMSWISITRFDSYLYLHRNDVDLSG
ncbi:hypothetical protein FPV67DRAFT_1450712 [Lyophyllum atratum]|nr:hypothetical protein FPV67DRAFT_1450712 [Lyophyllum atratum]